MILTILLNFFFVLIVGFLKVLPDISSNSNFGNAIHTASGYISSVYSFLPVITVAILGILFIDIAFESSYFLFKMIYWIIRRLPTQS